MTKQLKVSLATVRRGLKGGRAALCLWRMDMAVGCLGGAYIVAASVEHHGHGLVIGQLVVVPLDLRAHQLHEVLTLLGHARG